MEYWPANPNRTEPNGGALLEGPGFNEAQAHADFKAAVEAWREVVYVCVAGADHI